jgi:hypothetical protein
MTSDTLKTCTAILAYLGSHPGSYLYEWQGSTLTSQGWRIRHADKTPGPSCHANAARAAWRRRNPKP